MKLELLQERAKRSASRITMVFSMEALDMQSKARIARTAQTAYLQLRPLDLLSRLPEPFMHPRRVGWYVAIQLPV